MSKQFEIKSAAGEVLDVDTTGRRVVAYSAVFHSVDDRMDTIKPGAFRKTLLEAKDGVPHLMQHKPELLVGTAFGKEDDYGLKTVSNIPKTRLGDDYLAMVDAKTLKANSFGYYALQHSPNSYGGRNLSELHLLEVSSVTFPSNPDAKILGVKAAMLELLERDAVLQKALRTGNMADETYLYLEEKQAEIKSAILDLLVDKPLETSDEPEPAKATTLPAAIEPEVKQAVEIANKWARFYAAYTK